MGAPVDPTHILSIAGDHGRDVGVDGLGGAAGIDANAAARVAALHGNLIAGTTGVVRPAKSASYDLEQQGVVVDRCSGSTEVVLDSGFEIAKERQCLGAHFEGETMWHAGQIGRRVGQVTGFSFGDGAFDVARAVTTSPYMTPYMARDLRSF